MDCSKNVLRGAKVVKLIKLLKYSFSTTIFCNFFPLTQSKCDPDPKFLKQVANRTQSNSYKLYHSPVPVQSQFISMLLSTRGGWSQFFRLRLRSCSKIFESEYGYSSNLRIRLLFRLRRQSSIQPQFIHLFT